MIQDCSMVSFCRLLEWLYTGRCDFNLSAGINASRGAAKLSDTEILEVMQLADQFCLTELVTAIEVKLSERIIAKIQNFSAEMPAVSEQPKTDPQLEQLLDELVG